MKNSTTLTEAGQRYATAYDAHYTEKDMHKALSLYEDIMATHPDAEEAGYSRSQVKNIVNSVVPEHKIMDSFAGLARTHFEQGALPGVVSASA